MESRIDHDKTSPASGISPEPNWRHITVSSQRGVVTELERVDPGSGSANRYILRYHRASEATIISVKGTSDELSWTGFRFGETDWSFVNRCPLQPIPNLN